MAGLTSKDIDKYTKEDLKKMLEKKEEIERKQLEEQKRKKKKQKLADWLVPFIVFVNIVFTVLVLILFARTGTEPAVLIERWFQFTGVELIAMAGIQITKNLGEHFGRDDD